jgi:hypothetical protein
MLFVKSAGEKHHQRRYYQGRIRKRFRIHTGPGVLGHEKTRSQIDNISQGSERKTFQGYRGGHGHEAAGSEHRHANSEGKGLAQ